MKNQILLLASILTLSFTACQKAELAPPTGDTSPIEGELKSGKSGKNFTAHLSGDQEVPPAETNATGQAIFHLKNNGTELHYKLIVANIQDVFMAHIHWAYEGQNGPIVAWLFPDGPPPSPIPGPVNGVLAEGVITADDLTGPLENAEVSDLIDQFLDGRCYVNVHTTAFPSGEIRGQI